MIERKIGEVFKVGGITVQCVETTKKDKLNPFGCPRICRLSFFPGITFCNSRREEVIGHCSASFRSDKKAVHFIKIENGGK